MERKDLEKLREPFPPEALGVRVLQKKERQDSMGTVAWLLVAPYIPVHMIRERLDEVDPDWRLEIVSFHVRDPGKTVIQKRHVGTTVAVALTVKGITRVGAGDGEDARAALSFALKNAASQFGIGAFLKGEEYAPRVLSCDPDTAKRVAFHWTWKDVLEFTAGDTEKERTTEAAPQASRPARRGGLSGEAKALFREVRDRGLDPADVLRRGFEEGILAREHRTFHDLTPEEIEAIREHLDEWSGEEEVPF